MRILATFVLLVLSAVLMFFGILFLFLRFLFGGKWPSGGFSFIRTWHPGRPSDDASSASVPSAPVEGPASCKKIFADDEGEYVDFEEVGK